MANKYVTALQNAMDATANFINPRRIVDKQLVPQVRKELGIALDSDKRVRNVLLSSETRKTGKYPIGTSKRQLSDEVRQQLNNVKKLELARNMSLGAPGLTGLGFTVYGLQDGKSETPEGDQAVSQSSTSESTSTVSNNSDNNTTSTENTTSDNPKSNDKNKNKNKNKNNESGPSYLGRIAVTTAGGLIGAIAAHKLTQKRSKAVKALAIALGLLGGGFGGYKLGQTLDA